MIKKFFFIFLFFSLYLFALPTGKEIAEKSFYVNRAMFLDNLSIKQNKRKMATVVKRVKNKNPLIFKAERFLNNRFKNKNIKNKDLIIIRSGKLRGTGVLITEFSDESRSKEFLLWLPALRKVRRISQPQKDGGYGEIDMAFIQENKLRQIDDEYHQLLSKESFVTKLDFMDLDFSNRNFKDFPQSKIDINTTVYKLKSIPTFSTDSYDYRISYIDSDSFVDYRDIYYKDSMVFKVIERRWEKINIDNPYAYMWVYWYSKDLDTGFESCTFIPQESIFYNEKVKERFYSSSQLQKIKR